MLNHDSLSLQQAVRKRGRPAFSRKNRGGDPQYFRRFGPFLADALGLARPETPGETLQSAIQQGLVSLPLLWWGGLVMMTRQSVTAVPTLTQATGRMLAGSPKADVAGTVGAATAGTLAQQHGAGPFGTIAAAAAGAMAGGRVGAGGKAGAGGKTVPGGAAARGGGGAAAKGAVAAEDAAQAAAKGEAKAAVSEGKPGGKGLVPFRTDADLQASHQQLKSIKPEPEDFLYTPSKEVAAGSIYQIEKLAQNLKKDLGVAATPVEVSPG